MAHYYEHINLLILPTDACNMNCTYCFHRPYSCHFEKISIQTIKHLLDITTPYYKRVNIIWHGGEPLLMGLDFYKEVVGIQKAYDCRITNAIQSNLTLLTPEMADFFAENNISISGSFDGVCNEQLRGHSEEILAGRQLMLDRGKRCGLIMVVSGKNVDHLIESYYFFKDIGVNFSLNLYLEQKDAPRNELTLDAETAADRLSKLFDCWVADSTGNIHISYFRNILEFLLLRRKNVCSYTSCMGRWLGIHYDGAIGPCNRYFPEEYCFGNLLNYKDIGEAFESNGFVRLMKKAIERRDKCKNCDVFDFCSGGCNNAALNENGIDSNGGLSCQILLRVYQHIEAVVTSISSRQMNIQNCNPLLKDMIQKSTTNVV